MINGLSREIIDAANELRNLKTAHRHGLGNTLFYRYYHTLTSLTPQQITRVGVVVTMAEDALFPPYITLTWTGDQTFEWTGILFLSTKFNEAAKTVTFDLGLASASTELELVITSSDKVTNIARTL